MYICICYGITDHEIRDAIEQGANSREKIADLTGAGTCCGRCGEVLDDLFITQKKTASVYPQAVLYHSPSAALLS